LEALVYEMPFRLIFRKAVLWHGGRRVVFPKFREEVRDANELVWRFSAECAGLRMAATLNGRGDGAHRLPYTKTDCTGTFEVTNNSRAGAQIVIHANGSCMELITECDAVLEIAGQLNQ
jgi:hypothetical protein